MLRFVKNCKERGRRITSPVLSLEEITKAERLWRQGAQRSAVRDEMTDLRNSKGVCHRSKHLTYHLFINDQDVVRVGVRLQKAKLAFFECHPVLLPTKHKVTELVIRSEHLNSSSIR